MKKLILFLLFPVLLQAQVEYLGIVEVDTVKWEWGDTFDKLTSFIERHDIKKTADGKQVIFIPKMKVYKKIKRNAAIVDGHFVLFTYDDENDIVRIESPESWLIEYDIKNKEQKEPKKYDTDVYDSTKPKDLEKKIKDKLKKPK